MFHNITPEILQRMDELEKRQLKELEHPEDFEGHEKLYQISPQSGQFLSLTAANSPKGNWLEIGTSAGYSGLWISLACKLRDTTLTTIELSPYKIKLATETFANTNIDKYITIVQGNALEHVSSFKDVSFCFLDAEKKIYKDCYDILIPNMVPGGILIADNVLSHNRLLKPMINNTLKDNRVDAMIVPIGSGLLLARKL